MRLTRKLLFAVCVTFAGILSLSSPIFAEYTITPGHFYVSHRVYEDSGTLNMVIFDMKDDSGQPFSNGDAIINVGLYDPNQNQVNLSPFYFKPPYEILSGSFDLGTSQWVYGPSVLLNEIGATIFDSLLVGTYRLEVLMEDGLTYLSTYEVTNLIDLPVISSRSCQITSDSAGNIFWSWKAPPELISLSRTLGTSQRIYISAFQGTKLMSVLFLSVPTEMSFAYFPTDLIQALVSKGDNFGYEIQVRTTNNNCRSYSKEITVSSPLTTIVGVDGDINGDGKIGLEEAINALQCVTGLR